MKWFIFCAACLLVCRVTFGGETAALADRIKAQVEELNRATLEGRFDSFVKLTHPKIIEQMGGEQKAKDALAKQFLLLKLQGLSVAAITVGTPSEPVVAGDHIYVVVPFVLQVRSREMQLALHHSFMIGVSFDKGENWQFVNGDLEVAKVKEILADLPDTLTLPQRQAPEVIEVDAQVKSLVAELGKINTPGNVDDVPAVGALANLGMAGLEAGSLDLLASDSLVMRRFGELVLTQVITRRLGYMPGKGWKDDIDRSAEVQQLWKANGDYRWNDDNAERRTAAYRAWKKWVAEVRAVEQRPAAGK